MAEEQNEKQADGVPSDGVNRAGLDYRAGYCEGIMAFLTRLRVEAARAKPKEHAGMQSAANLAASVRGAMLEKMKGGK